MKKISALIVDDEPDARDFLVNILKNYEDIEVVATAENVDKAINLIIKSLPDLVFLDIQMPVKSGFDLLDELKSLNITYPEFVFVTAYNEFALKAIKKSAFDFLLKPIDFDDLDKCIQKYRTKTLKTDFVKKIDLLYENLNNSRKIKISTRYGFIAINPNEIIYCTADGSYTELVLEHSKTETFTNHLAVLEEILPVSHFFRISRSQIINTNYLFSLIRKEKACILKDGNKEIKLYVSASRIKDLEDIF